MNDGTSRVLIDLELLKQMEWNSYMPSIGPHGESIVYACCPCCKADRDLPTFNARVHESTCALAAAIAEGESDLSDRFLKIAEDIGPLSHGVLATSELDSDSIVDEFLRKKRAKKGVSLRERVENETTVKIAQWLQVMTSADSSLRVHSVIKWLVEGIERGDWRSK